MKKMLFGMMAITLILGCNTVNKLLSKKESSTATPSSSPPSSSIKIEGLYAVQGTNPDGGSYSGNVAITPKGNVYELQWSVGTPYSGIGIRSQDVLSVSWGTPGGSGFGIVAYKIDPDGSLHGTWATPDNTRLGTETLTPQ